VSRGIGGGPEVVVASATLLLFRQRYVVTAVASERLPPDTLDVGGAPSLATVLLEVWAPGEKVGRTLELCCDEARTLGLALKEASRVGVRSYPP
jgi:hypothetical protein